MHPLAKRIALLFSAFSLVIGLFLLLYNLQLITEQAVGTALNLWPILLVAAGAMLVGDSAKKRATAHAARITMNEFPLPIPMESEELSMALHFSYGRLLVERAETVPRLVTEDYEPRPAPVIRQEMVGTRSEISVSVSQPIFPTHLGKGNTWRLLLPPRLPLKLSFQLHEADMRLDLRNLLAESIELRTEAGSQEVLVGPPTSKMRAQIYCSGSGLSLVLPSRVFALVRLLNPFCRVDYPQGDMEKREDGSLVTTNAAAGSGSVEIDVDGPIRGLILDIEDTIDEGAGPET